jgi:hypothetical protein
MPIPTQVPVVPPDDDLYRKAARARDDVQALWMAEHYLSVPGGVASPPGYYRNRKP